MFAEFLNFIFKTKQNVWLLPYKMHSRVAIWKYVRFNKGPVRVNIGSGDNILPGWLNGEVWPGRGTVYMDAAKTLPFKNGSVSFINCEHMIEHLDYQASKKFMKECFRALRPGGILRIATPDLKKLISMYSGESDIPTHDILRHHNDYHDREAGTLCEWFNDHMHLWGHSFIFDEETLIKDLRHNGFAGIEKCSYGESRYPELRNIEKHDEKSEWMKSAYIMVLEAKKKD